MPLFAELAEQTLKQNPQVVVFGPVHGYPRTRKGEHRISYFAAPKERISPENLPALEDVMDSIHTDLVSLVEDDIFERTKFHKKRNGALVVGRLSVAEDMVHLRQVWDMPGPKGTFVIERDEEGALNIIQGRQRFEKTPARLFEVCLYGDPQFTWYTAEYQKQYYAGSVDYDPIMQKLRHEIPTAQVLAMAAGNPPLAWLAGRLDRFRP